ncbi:hypothetical protein PPUN109347_07010 [Pseudomonas putida]|nr:hypothetical protein PPUN109347_07010 [Pseudomonas putida]
MSQICPTLPAALSGVLTTDFLPLYISSQIGAIQRPQPCRLDDLQHVDQVDVIDLSPQSCGIGHLIELCRAPILAYRADREGAAKPAVAHRLHALKSNASGDCVVT